MGTLRGLVKQYILDNIKTDDFSNRTLARQMCEQQPEIFGEPTEKNIDRLRFAIRVVRDAAGSKHTRNRMKEPIFVREEQKPSEYMAAFMAKANYESNKPKHWTLPQEHAKVLVMSDIHFPHHTMSALGAALDFGIQQNIDGIYLNGDIIDFKSISRWDKEPDTIRLADEIEMLKEFLDMLIGFDVPIYYKLGNHEDRYYKKLLKDAPELFDLPDFKIEKILGLEERGIPLIDTRTRAMFGRLTVVHGHEFGESIFSPVNPARGLFMKAKADILAGHHHQRSQHQESDIRGQKTRCYSTGCLCDLEPNYRPFAFTKWNHGAAIVEVGGDDFSVLNFGIEGSRIVF
jgi:predicted phosphodiesterase